MRILIAGGFGFVGGRLAQHLQQAGHQIVLGSRNATNIPNWLPNVAVAKTHWNDERALEEICGGVDVVIQAAGMNARECATDPVAALELNGVATARLAKAASHAAVKRFIYLSTAHVYANPLTGIISENTCPRNLHPYATSHLAAENVILSASQRGQFEGIVLRLSNVFGAPMHKQVNCWMLLANDLCRQAIETGKMVLHSNGLQQRDFIAMTEVCRVVQSLITYDFGISQPGIFNVGSGVSHSILEMAKRIQQRSKLVLGFDPELDSPETGGDEAPELLMYQTEKLAQMNIKINTENNTEIDTLLAFCKASYSKNKET